MPSLARLVTLPPVIAHSVTVPSWFFTSSFSDEWGFTSLNAVNAPVTFASFPSAYAPAREWCACSEAPATRHAHKTTHPTVHLVIRTPPQRPHDAELAKETDFVLFSAIAAISASYISVLTLHALMPDLRDGGTVLVNLAIAPLPHKPRVGIGIAAYRSRRQHPRFHEHLGVFDRDVVQNRIALSRESLHDVHPIGVEESASSQPGRV